MYHVYIWPCMYVCMPVCRKATCGNIAVCNPLKINHVYRKKKWKAYLLFYCFCNLQPLPSSVHDLCRYIIFLAANLNVYQSIKNYLNGVRVLHACNGIKFALLDNFEARLVLQAVKRRLRNAPLAKLPVTPDMLMLIYCTIDVSEPFHAALWCSYLFAFFAFLRKSNVVSRSLASFDTTKHLTRGDVLRTRFGLTLILGWSKTVQFKNRVLQIPLCEIPGHILDAVKAFENMCRLSPAAASAPAFSYCTRQGGLDSVTYSKFSKVLLSKLSEIGLDPFLYSGHSFRRSGCSFAFISGVPAKLLKSHGD